jgi:transposase
MRECMLVGCDLHEKSMLLKIARGRGAAGKATWSNTPEGWEKMLGDLRRRASGGKIVFAYEASALGFGLYDFLTDAGVRAHVLAPTKIARSVRERRTKCDEKDAEKILELLRGHVLAGNALPDVWVPDVRTREDREIVRGRLDVSVKTTRLKTQVNTLLKRNGVRRPGNLGKGWTLGYRAWLRGLAGRKSALPYGCRVHLGSLLRQLGTLEEELATLEGEIEALSQTERYAETARRMMVEGGVGLFTAMVMLTELGDLRRFSNRKQLGAFLGLTPSSDETGEGADRKGHITHQGPWRVRRTLCQMVWAKLRTDAEERAYYDMLTAKNPKKKKIAVVACMRRLAVRLWHVGMEAQREAGVFGEARIRRAG